MATKQELTAGLQFLVQEARRVSNDFTDAEWDRVVDLDGWKNREVLAHLAGIGGIVVPMVNGVTQAPAGSDAFAAIDIDVINAGIVSQRADKSAEDLAAEVEKSYGAVIEWIDSSPDDLLSKRATVRGYQDVTIGDLINRMVVLHGLGHIYSVYAAVFNAGK